MWEVTSNQIISAIHHGRKNGANGQFHLLRNAQWRNFGDVSRNVT
jgi:hypothetical protein